MYSSLVDIVVKREIHLKLVGTYSWHLLRIIKVCLFQNTQKQSAISGPRNSPKTAISGPRNGKNCATIILGLVTGQMVQFLGPEIVQKLQFLGPEMVKIVQQLFGGQKLTKWCNFLAQKLTLWASDPISVVLIDPLRQRCTKGPNLRTRFAENNFKLEFPQKMLSNYHGKVVNLKRSYLK